MDDSKSSLAVPVIVVIAIIVIAGALYYYKPGASTPADNATSTTPVALNQVLQPAEGANLSKFRPVDSTDKILGSSMAPIKIVAYTDLECPACKFFHQQIEAIKTNYIDTGKVAIIYRDFPLDSLHSKSRNEFTAAECVNEIGGNDKFWQFVDKIFTVTPSNNGLDQAILASTAKELGINAKDLDTCIKGNKYASAIQKSVDEALAIGAQGTPYLVVTGPNNVIIPVFGGIPANTLGTAFDMMLGVSSSTTASTTAE